MRVWPLDYDDGRQGIAIRHGAAEPVGPQRLEDRCQAVSPTVVAPPNRCLHFWRVETDGARVCRRHVWAVLR